MTRMDEAHCFVGCAGWSLPRAVQGSFPAHGSHLQRYAAVFNATEINSSFHRPHAAFVWRRWRESVPPHFRFCAKLPKAITHERRLVGCEPLLDDFLARARDLRDHLACVLVQLPPSLAFDEPVARSFLQALRARWPRGAALEPRHASWFTPRAHACLAEHRIARVLADPVRFASAAAPGGWPGLVYVRLHGSPRMYYSAYEPALVGALAYRIAMELRLGRDVWCIFDNTAAGAAPDNALTLQAALARETA
jgi:uncharacterized protein YecE (DUF72 family)